MTTPADWYQDPEGNPGDLRYWDGTQWTDYRQAAAAAAAPPAAAPPVVPPPIAPPTMTPPPPGTPPAKKSNAPLIAVLAIVVVLLIGGGITAALVLGGGSSSKSPKAYAASFCKKETAEATKLKDAQESLKGEDLDQIADFLSQTATFLDNTAANITSLGAPDTSGGKQMLTELPASLKATAKDIRSIVSDVRDGDLTALNEFDDLDIASDLGSQASTAWETIQAQIDASDAPSSCQALNDIFK